ncbi:MAG: hypothetical protein V1891_03165 [bacterium]
MTKGAFGDSPLRSDKRDKIEAGTINFKDCFIKIACLKFNFRFK